MSPARGKAYIVGAGPGDPGLITVKGLEAIQRADVIIYDRLMNPYLLSHAPAGGRVGLRRQVCKRQGHGAGGDRALTGGEDPPG